MAVRKRALPPGWYPSSAGEVERQFENWEREAPSDEKESALAEAVAGIVPHAGWSFSGYLAYRVFRLISRSVDTLVVVGGHMSSTDPVVAAGEENYETPFGPVEADSNLLTYLKDEVKILQDPIPDNTVEVQLPFVAGLFSGKKALYLRAPGSDEAAELGRKIAQAEKDLGKTIAVIGSTDLTHYGPDYGFTPKGTGQKAQKWVKEENDREIIEAFLNMNSKRVMEKALKDKAACSPGGPVAAIEFAAKKGVSKGSLVGYSLSSDIMPRNSFVGYAGVVFR
jgi:MEMO1 family protein